MKFLHCTVFINCEISGIWLSCPAVFCISTVCSVGTRKLFNHTLKLLIIAEHTHLPVTSKNRFPARNDWCAIWQRTGNTSTINDSNARLALSLKSCRQVQQVCLPNTMTISEVNASSFWQHVDINFPSLFGSIFMTNLPHSAAQTLSALFSWRKTFNSLNCSDFERLQSLVSLCSWPGMTPFRLEARRCVRKWFGLRCHVGRRQSSSESLRRKTLIQVHKRPTKKANQNKGERSRPAATKPWACSRRSKTA